MEQRGRARTTRVIAIASGKGGVGKTTLAVNLAVAWAMQGRRVAVLDADLGLANVDVLLGLVPHASLADVLHGTCRLADVMVPGPEGIHVIPAASGMVELATLTTAQQGVFLDEIETLAGVYDVLLVDVAAGVTPTSLYFTAAAGEPIVLTTPEPTAITDAYAVIKLLARRHERRRCTVVVNMAHDARDAERTFAHLSRVAARFLRVELEYGGWVPLDPVVGQAVRRQSAVVSWAPATPATVAMRRLAERLQARPPVAASGGLQFFFRQLVGEGRA